MKANQFMHNFSRHMQYYMKLCAAALSANADNNGISYNKVL